MSFGDIWTILAGGASILSLVLVMTDRFPQWKKFLAPVGFVLGGFALGRISSAVFPGEIRSVQDTRLMGFFLILTLILGAILLVCRMVKRMERDWYLLFILFMVISMGIPSLLDKYSSAFPDIPKEDYLVLASAKEQNGDFGGAVNYLEKYKNLVSNDELVKQTEKKITNLQNRQLLIE